MRVTHGELPATAKKHMTGDLPADKSLQDVFADFIRYLFNSTKAFIQEREPMGEELWESLGSNIDLILTEKVALSRVSFVTEGEATFNFCVTNTNSGELLKVVFSPLNPKGAF